MKTDQELLQDASDALHALFKGFDEGDLDDMHDDNGCPADDTCECASKKILKQVSDVLNDLDYRLRWVPGKRIALRGLGATEAHKVKKLEGNQVVTECNLVHHHEHYFVITEERAGIVFHQGNIPGCYVCYPEEQADYLPPGTHLAIHGAEHRDGTRTMYIGCMSVGQSGWTLRAAMKAADEGDSGSIVEVIDRKACPTHGLGGEEEEEEEEETSDAHR